MLALTLALADWPQRPHRQQTFATPKAAVDALMAARKADSDASMLAIFGDDYKHLIVQDDRAAASANRAKVYQSMQTLRVLRELDRGLALAVDRRRGLAAADPDRAQRRSPALRQRNRRGRARRIDCCVGANERNAIDVLRAFVDVERADAVVDRDGDGVRQYAQKLASTPGKQDGLDLIPPTPPRAWRSSPFGPLIAESAADLKVTRWATLTAAIVSGSGRARAPTPEGAPPTPDQRSPDRRLRDGGLPA